MSAKMLLIVPRFFSYEIKIKNLLEKLGFNVFIIYENVNEFSIKCKIAKVLKKEEVYLDNYYIKKINRRQFDIVLAIRASTLSLEVIDLLRKNSPDAKFYLYQWDGVNNNSNAVRFAPLFDKVSTFDIDDSKSYGWRYRPLFYTDETQRNGNRFFDFTYICTLHSDRLRIYKKLKQLSGQNFLYIYSKFSHYIKEKYIKKNPCFLGISDSEIKYKALKPKKMNSILSKTNIVVDYTHPGQSGFTMRTCEAIGHRCKLITNNKNVMEADFYNPNNIYVYDINSFFIPNEFIRSPYIELSKNIYNYYSIESWLREIIDYE